VYIFLFCYNFIDDPKNSLGNYNNMDHLKIIIRYYLKAFFLIGEYFGLFNIAKTDKSYFFENELRIIHHYYENESGAIEYIQLTDLGRFVLGLEKSFKGKNDFSLTLNPFTFDFKVSDSNKAAFYLSTFATKISEDRYQTNLKLLMGGIDSVEKYQTFKEQFLGKCDTVPDNWKGLFETLDRRIGAVKVVSQTAILLEVTNPKEILQIITANPKLQEKILKADQMHLVVLKENLGYVKKIFKEYGVVL